MAPFSTCRRQRSKEQDTIVKAILNGDVTTVRAMAKNTGNNILWPDKYGWIPLHEAAYYGQDQCVRVLLGAQPSMINKCDLKGQTALILAVYREKVACVETLLEKGADPDLANKDRETPLYKACESGNAEIVVMLLNHGAVVNKHCIQGCTALQEAVSRNNVEICEILVQAGAKLSPTNMYGIAPLFTAAQSGHVLISTVRQVMGPQLCMKRLRMAMRTLWSFFFLRMLTPTKQAIEDFCHYISLPNEELM
ncbi:unnamed protein product, partial [Coregonus sp. 'balchen']